MNSKIKRDGNVITVVLSGSIDIPGAENLKKILNKIVDEGPEEVIIDFEEVSFIGSSGIGKLLLFYKNFTSKGAKVKIININKEIKALFKAIKLDSLFNI